MATVHTVIHRRCFDLNVSGATKSYYFIAPNQKTTPTHSGISVLLGLNAG